MAAEHHRGSRSGHIDSYWSSTSCGSIVVMGVEKMSVSFDLELGEAIRVAAHDSGQSARPGSPKPPETVFDWKH